MSGRMSLTVGLFTVVVLIGSWFTTPAFATFCQISSISYNYPQQVLPGQSFSTTVTVSGVCAPDDANYYSVRSDLNDISGFVLSAVSVPIGFSQGQNWTVNVQNQVTAPTSSASWQIQFAVYIFAAVGSGGDTRFSSIQTSNHTSGNNTTRSNFHFNQPHHNSDGSPSRHDLINRTNLDHSSEPNH